ncbi:hypothetical protein CLOM_g17579 [Closterium sp. NIES-68]|nr:hypothetical protein CLOM_g17579 [Closterium sp. NIES-68]GJP86657.1 hypothetical protein CLOP_g16653 [Closterium sp. NIES-67]
MALSTLRAGTGLQTNAVMPLPTPSLNSPRVTAPHVGLRRMALVPRHAVAPARASAPRQAASSRPVHASSTEQRVDSPRGPSSSEERGRDGTWLMRGAAAAGLACVLALSDPFSGSGGMALAADTLKTCTCLLGQCRTELLQCLGDVKCAANIACLQACNGRPDETECQIGCGDLFENQVVDRFNACAITKSGCVPQKADENLFPLPPDEALVPEFDVGKLDGEWFIASGLNPTFDTYDCQLHTFKPTGEGEFRVDITWRINTPDGGFFTRSALQDFMQEPARPGVLLNHDNEFLHYQDDWFIISSSITGSKDDYFFVYYRGSNDAWDGYGGAVVYTRARTLPKVFLPEMERAAESVGLKFADFTTTDNTCPAEVPLFARLERKVEEVERAVVAEVVQFEEKVVEAEKGLVAEVIQLEEKVVEAGKDEVKLFEGLRRGFMELFKDEQNFVKGLKKEDREVLEQMEAMQMGDAEDLEDLFSNPLPLRKIRPRS